MAQNDLILLDSLLSKAAPHYGQGLDEGEVFELFCFDQLLKDYELQIDELESGWVDSGDDGGIDGFFVFLNERLLNVAIDEEFAPKTPHFDVWIISSKRGQTFRQSPLNSLMASLPELFDLGKSEDDITYPFEQTILDVRDTFTRSYINLAGSRPTLRIHVVYASRGDATMVAPNISSRGNQLQAALQALFSNCQTVVTFVGASELLEIALRRKAYSLRLKFIENPISREQTNYVLLSRLSDYCEFVTDEEGALRRYLFEANVRDYMGSVPVNRDIASTLSANPQQEKVDFWWLNNGITILASFATIAGKEISLENVQIVNGLQTTESIFSYFKASNQVKDDRAVLVKIIVAEDPEIRDRIIKATNYQNPVELASLRATEKIQRDIEQYLADHGWYYDRRRNFYKNQGMPAERIVSMTYLASCVRAVALRDPLRARRQRPKFMRVDSQYKQVFDDRWPLDVFVKSLEIVRAAEGGMRTKKLFRNTTFGDVHAGAVRDAAYVVAYTWAVRKLGRPSYTPADIVELKIPNGEEVQDTVAFILNKADEFCRSPTTKPFKSLTKLLRTKEFVGVLY
ncbi:MAG: AIPR family protein [Pirellulales bacterium]